MQHKTSIHPASEDNQGRLTQPLKWHGGKHYLAHWIISHMPPHLHYVEPYFGGGSVLLARDPNRDWMGEEKLPSHQRGSSEVVNDLNGELMNFWRVLQSEELFPQFRRLVELSPVSQQLWQEAENTEGSQVERAAKFFIRARQSRQGLGSCFTTLSRSRTRRRMQESASSWLSAVDGLPDVHARLRRVVILNDDAINVIRQQDGDRTHFYVDPPYFGAERSGGGEYGAYEMTESQHRELLETLATITGTFQLSDYHSDLYDSFAAKQGWRCEECVIDNKASSRATKERKTECLWMNY